MRACHDEESNLQVGGFILMELSDLRKMSPLWLKYSEDVRFDPDVRLRPANVEPELWPCHSPHHRAHVFHVACTVLRQRLPD